MDNYSKNIARFCLMLCFITSFGIGLITGYLYIKTDEILHEYERDNLIKIYEVKE